MSHWLRNKTIWVTRSPRRAQGIVIALERYGAHVAVVPTTAIVPLCREEEQRLREALIAPKKERWLLFTSANSVLACGKLLGTKGFRSFRIAAIGPATKQALDKESADVDIVSSGVNSREVACKMVEMSGGRTLDVVFPRSSSGRAEAVLFLQQKDANVEVVDAYHSHALTLENLALRQMVAAVEKGEVHALVCFAPSQIKALIGLDEKICRILQQVPILAAIGKTTASQWRREGLEATVVADRPDNEHLAYKIAKKSRPA